MRKLYLILLSLILSVTMLAVTAAPATATRPDTFKTHIALPFEEEGVHDGAAYEIRVPENWNGTLIVYAHGLAIGTDEYGLPTLIVPEPKIAPGGEDLAGESYNTEQDLLNQGYALAGSSYGSAGWAVKEGIQTTLALTNYFNGKVGKPKRTILWGLSMGGLIALESIEKYPDIYDAAISESGVNAGSTIFDTFVNAWVAYDVIFGWPESWGRVGNFREDISASVVFSELQSDILPPSGKSELFRLILGFPDQGSFYNGVWSYMWFATIVAANMEQRCGGNPLQNTDAAPVVLSDADIAYLHDNWGLDAVPYLTEINNTEVEAQKSARNHLEHYATPTGDITHPVITLYCIYDPISPVIQAYIYNAKVLAAGKGDLLLQAYTDTPIGHGVFNEGEYLQTVAAMQSWLETGSRPIPASAFSDPGFIAFYP